MLGNNFISWSATSRLAILSIMVLLPQSLLQATAQTIPTDVVILTTTTSSASLQTSSIPKTSSILQPTTSAHLDPFASLSPEDINLLPSNITQEIVNAAQTLNSDHAQETVVGIDNPFALTNVTAFDVKFIEKLFAKKNYSVRN